MDLNELTTFTAVARSGGISAAAREIHTVQSNVTMRIKALEDEIGLALFERHSRGMALTEAGQRLLPYAERVLSLLREAKIAARDNAAEQGVLQLGSMETTAAIRLPPLLAAFHQACPAVRLSLQTGPTAQLVEGVLRREIDGAFVAGPIQHDEIAALPVFEETLGLVTPAAIDDLDALRRSASTGLSVLTFRPGCSYRQRLEQVLARLGLPSYARLEFGTLDGILGCVAAGVGITLLPKAVFMQSAQRDALRWHPIDGEEGAVTTLFIRRRDAYESRALQRFLGLMRREPDDVRPDHKVNRSDI
ncbi:DNA-binding transcriptional regulator, LysR family [Bosea sp. OK403]|uniref:LysR family transcriptional regulator n=1 Tax=Bosea sp. OK403 TaxID=1855286 RepID=UPI0008E21A32|nr:LysR family transcriptional regulator [Bosea sp. OK403]SFI39519.1 DNA-binding transcriptional regulator, LysR family [Bosea sp. OK403]